MRSGGRAENGGVNERECVCVCMKERERKDNDLGTFILSFFFISIKLLWWPSRMQYCSSAVVNIYNNSKTLLIEQSTHKIIKEQE